MMPFRKTLSLLAATFATVISAPAPASAYQIDCAILLCLAGGFPPSAPCAAARAEMIRRITPWPIEPPLQLWRCPMRAEFMLESGPTAGAPTSIAFTTRHLPLPQSLEPTTEALPVYDSAVESYLAAIKVYDLSYRRHRSHDGDCNVSSRLQIGSYDAWGNFAWHRADASASPSWVFNTSYSQCSEASFRAVGLEWRDYEGEQGTEVIKY
jgi:hypothetical protein